MTNWSRGGVGNKQEGKYIVEIKRKDNYMPPLLFDFLRLATPHGMEHHIVNLFPFKKEGRLDDKGNFILKIQKKDGTDPDTLFSAHMDTVHSVDQRLIEDKSKFAWLRLLRIAEDAPGEFEQDKNYIWGGVEHEDKKGPKFGATQLGADDKVGCWLLSEMIDHEIPGLYIFHVGEERGCIGSSYIADKTPEVLKGIKRAIAFDRAGTTDVIGFQRGSRCASTEFTTALADQLNTLIDLPKTHMTTFKPDIHGVYTDTAKYTKLVQECTNISVGYYDQHGGNEKLDLWWVTQKFLPAVLQMDWDDLPVIKEVDKDYSYPTSYSRNYDSGYWDTRVWDKDRMEWVDRNEFKNGKKADYVAFKDVSIMTPPSRVPPWKPEDGIPLGIAYEGLMVLLRRWERNATKEELLRYLGRTLIIAENEELEAAINLVKLQKIEKIIGSELFNDIMNKPDPEDVAPEEPQQLALPKPEDKTRDQDGFPFDKQDMLERTRKKLTIIATFVTNREKIKLAKEQLKKFEKIVGAYSKLSKSLNNQKEVTKGLYRGVNRLLFNATSIILELKGCENAAVNNAVADAVAYMKDNVLEPGFPEKVV